MPAPSQVAISSQDARVTAENMGDPESAAREVNTALVLIRDDIQRLSGEGGTTKRVLTSGNYRMVCPVAGIMDLWALSDTATAGSTGVNYHTLGSTVNGFAQVTQTYDTRRQEIPSFKGGCYLGRLSVGYGDVVVVTLIVTGAPAPTLTTANFSLLAQLTET